MKKSASSLALAALCCFGGTLHAAAPAGGGSRLYCCQDSSGKQVCGDILPQVCYGRAYREIGADGRTVREVDAPLTAEQRAQKVAEDAKRKEEADVRNQAESLVYQTEKFVKDQREAEGGSKVPEETLTKVDGAIAEASVEAAGEEHALQAAHEPLLRGRGPVQGRAASRRA